MTCYVLYLLSRTGGRRRLNHHYHPKTGASNGIFSSAAREALHDEWLLMQLVEELDFLARPGVCRRRVLLSLAARPFQYV